MNELHERILSALTAATLPPGSDGVFNPNLHPRGAGGRFIVVGGVVQVLGPNGQPVSQGTVTSINPANGLVSVQDSRTGQISVQQPSSLASAPTAKATIPVAKAVQTTALPSPPPTPASGPLSPTTTKGTSTPPIGTPTQGTGQRALSNNPTTAAYQGRLDAMAGHAPLTSGDPRALYAYAQAYQSQQSTQAGKLQQQAAAAARAKAAAARAAAAAARARAAAAKRAAAAAAKKAKAAKAGTKTSAKGGYKYVAYRPGSPIAKNTKPNTDLGA